MRAFFQNLVVYFGWPAAAIGMFVSGVIVGKLKMTGLILVGLLVATGVAFIPVTDAQALGEKVIGWLSGAMKGSFV